MAEQKKSPLVIIFLTVFIYLVGFGIMIPIMPVLGRDFGASAWQFGLLMSVYSIMQFVFAPLWGQLSDRYGRRPILLLCLLGEGLSYLLLAWARSLEMLFVARIAAGFFGASLSTANAYISDITAEHERSKGMGLIGAAFGLGFILGPAIGAGLAWWGEQISSEPFFANSFTAIWIAVLCFANFIFAFFKLSESLKKGAIAPARKKRLHILLNYLQQDLLGPLLLSFLLISISMSAMESMLIYLVADRFQWGLKEVYIGFSIVGLVSAFNQGFLIRKLLPRYGEKILLAFGAGFMALSLAMIAGAQTVFMMAVAMIIQSLGFSFFNPSAIGSISLLGQSTEQGSLLGVTQSLSSLGRVIGPAMGGLLYVSMHEGPFVAGAGLSVVALAIILYNFSRLPQSAKIKI